MSYEDKIKQETIETIARNLVDTLAVEFIAERLDLSVDKVEEFRREHEKSLCK